MNNVNVYYMYGIAGNFEWFLFWRISQFFHPSPEKGYKTRSQLEMPFEKYLIILIDSVFTCVGRTQLSFV